MRMENWQINGNTQIARAPPIALFYTAKKKSEMFAIPSKPTPLTPKEKLEKCLVRLKIIELTQPEKYPKTSFGAVSKMLEFEIAYEGKRRPYGKKFSKIEDFQLYFEVHKEWAGKSTKEMQKDKESGACAFYIALLSWARNEAKGEDKKFKQLMQSIFPPKNADWSNFKTLEQWKEYFDSKPEWAGKSTGQMQKDKESGANAFYIALLSWARNEAKGNTKRFKQLMQSIFPPKNADWSNFKTLEQWKEYFDSKPEWAGKSTKEMKKDKESGACAFYSSFKIWAKNEAKGEDKKFKQLMQSIFPPKYADWSNFKTLEQWKEYFDSKPEWAGRSTSDMKYDKESGARAFYTGFGTWSEKYAKENNLDQPEFTRKCMQTLFVSKKHLFFEFENGQVSFDSSPERIVGILLYKYGLIEKMQQGETIHVRTNGDRKHNTDFFTKIGLVEFHGLQINEIKNGKTHEDIKNEKKANITNEKFIGVEYHYISEVYHLYSEVLDKPEVREKMSPYYQMLTLEQFGEHVVETQKAANAYDAAHSELYAKKERKKKKN